MIIIFVTQCIHIIILHCSGCLLSRRCSFFFFCKSLFLCGFRIIAKSLISTTTRFKSFAQLYFLDSLFLAQTNFLSFLKKIASHFQLVIFFPLCCIQLLVSKFCKYHLHHHFVRSFVVQ